MKLSKRTRLACTVPNVMKVLETIVDPEIGINIVDLGLIFGVWIGKDEIVVDFTTTYPGCPVLEDIREMIEYELRLVFDMDKIYANDVWHTPWDPSLMAEEARIVLGY